MNAIKKLTVSVLILAMTVSCVTVRSGAKKKQNKIQGEAGRTLPVHSLSIDAEYDSRLDHLIEGRKTVSVIIRNMSLNNLPMDPKNDRWTIESEKGKGYKTTNSLRINEPVTWRSIPEDIRDKIDYPEVVPINYSVTFNLFLSKNAKLEYFRKIKYYNAALNQEFILEKYY